MPNTRMFWVSLRLSGMGVGPAVAVAVLVGAAVGVCVDVGVLEGASVAGTGEAVLVGVLLTAVGEGAGVFVSAGVGGTLATWGFLLAEQPTRHRAKTTKAARTAALEAMR